MNAVILIGALDLLLLPLDGPPQKPTKLLLNIEQEEASRFWEKNRFLSLSLFGSLSSKIRFKSLSTSKRVCSYLYVSFEEQAKTAISRSNNNNEIGHVVVEMGRELFSTA